MARIFDRIKSSIDLIILAIVLSLIFFKNYSPDTWLVGWDNLMPELNIGMNIKRSILAVWQEYQGLGLIGGMGHATDLIRQLIILPFTLILPHNLIRYLWHFFTISLGTFGVYFGLKKLKENNKFHSTIPLLSSLFYLLNFGSVQNYWAPFEPFSTFWGFFPWLIFSFWQVLQNHSKKNIIKFTLINLLAIPSFYVQTIFIVYLLCLGSILLSYLFFHKNGSILDRIKLSALLMIIIFCLNSFWLLPFGYFLKNGIQNPTSAFGNLLASEETFMRNQNRGNLLDFLILRGYYYDFPDSGGFLMPAWQQHLENPLVLVIGLLLSSISIYGLIRLLISLKKPNLTSISLLIIFFVCATALLSTTPPFSFLNYLIRQVSLLDQIFRSPFTKFIVPTVFSFSLLFAFGLNHLFSSIKNPKIKILFSYFIIPVLILIFSFPIFTGNFFSPEMRQKIPSDYFHLINFFKSKNPTDRIINLPSGSHWGWTSYRFGVRGSGFIWYGIENPILDRAFDVWNLKNEQYFWELNYAVQKQEPQLLKNIINKYDVSYIIFDNNIYFPNDPIYGQQATPTRDTLNTMDNLSLEAQFGQIYIYRVKTPQTVSIINNPQNILESNFYHVDPAYNELGNYQSSNNPTIIYPFANLFTNRLQTDLEFHISINNNQIEIKKTLPDFTKNYSLSIPNNSFSANLNNSEITATIPTNTTYKAADFQEVHLTTSSITQKNSQTILTENNQRFVRLKSYASNNFFVQYFPEATFNNSYLLKVEYRHLQNYPLTISAFSDSSRQIFFNTKLQSNPDWSTAWFLIPQYKNDDFDTGLTLILNNTTFNKKISVNDIKSIEIYPIPYYDLINTKISSAPTYQTSTSTPLQFSSNIFYYRVSPPKNISPNSYLTLPQTFDSGWKAFYINGLKPIPLQNHALVNNWQNGWELDSSQIGPIYVIFWPQILEFLGFFLLPVLFVTIFLL